MRCQPISLRDLSKTCIHPRNGTLVVLSLNNFPPECNAAESVSGENGRISEEELDEKIRNAVAAGRESPVAEIDARIQQSLGKALEQLSQPVTHFASPQGPPPPTLTLNGSF